MAFFYCKNCPIMPCNVITDTLLQARHSGPLGAASFFGFCGLVVYGVDAVLKFRGWRAGQLAQGERKVTQTVTNTHH